MMHLIFNFIPDYFSNLLGIPISTNPRLVIDVVAFLLLLFFGLYVRQALYAWVYLRRALLGLKKVCQQKVDGTIVSREDLQQLFKTPFFASVWGSFRDTLHEQYSFQGGQPQLTSIRSTVPAAAVFSTQSLVDARLNVEFFKHLPGILTGIGIIGTFYGLINGIQHFDPSLLAKAKADPAQMDKLFGGLKVLFEEVQGAFIASFFAIGAAMLITLLEKILINICYRKLEHLCQILDALYEGGVGEDYLASLVKSSAENATQTAQLKQSLVTDLSKLLFDLSEAQGKQSEALGSLLSAKIQEHIDASENHGEKFRADLKEGLADIGKTVAGVTDGQGDTMTGMLEDLIKSFSNNIQNTFGDQLKGQADMMNVAVASMSEMQTGFKTLLQDLRESGKFEREDLTSKVTSLVGALEAQQSKLENQITTFIEVIQSQIGISQQETMVQVRESLKDIQYSVSKVLTDMEIVRSESVSLERKQQIDFAETSKHLMTEMGAQVGGLVERNQQIVESMGEKVTSQLGDSLSSIHTSVANLLTNMEQDRLVALDTDRELHSQFAGTSKHLMTEMGLQVGGLVERNQQIVESMGEKVTSQLGDSLSSIHTSVAKLLADMEQERRVAIDTDRELHSQFAGTSKQLVLDMETHIHKLVEEIGKTVIALNENVNALDNTAINAIKGMNEGATRISSATGHFVDAGNKVSEVMNKNGDVAAQLSQSANSLAQASKSLDSQLSQYAVTRDALAKMVSEMNGMLERAKNEAGVNQQLIQKMQNTSDEFIKLNAEADKSFDNISKKLAETLIKFREDMSKHDTELHIQHADTLNQVASAYQPLAASIAGLTDMIAKTRAS
jgi:hypothetical protein